MTFFKSLFQNTLLIPWTCHYQHLELHLSTHVSSHAMETESPPVLEPSQLITDREGLIRLATGIDQGCGHPIPSQFVWPRESIRGGALFWLFRLLGMVAVVGVFRSCWSIATGGTCSRWRRVRAGAVVI